MTTPEPTEPSNLFSPFLPTTYNYPEEEDRIRVFLTDNFSNFADVINDKKLGVIVNKTETFSGEKWWYKNTKINRNGYQVIAYILSFPNIGTLTLTLPNIPESAVSLQDYPIVNVNPELIVTHVWGSASKPCSAIGAGDGVYFSFFSQGDSRITFTMTDIAIVITTTVNLSAYSGFIVIEYLRNGV